MQMGNPTAARPFMQVIDILRNDLHIISLFQATNRPMSRIGGRFDHLFAAGIVKSHHQISNS